jgi:hypothetical protein
MLVRRARGARFVWARFRRAIETLRASPSGRPNYGGVTTQLRCARSIGAFLDGHYMTYWLDLFTPHTWTPFQDNGANISGFRPRQRKAAFERVKQGDKFLCYLVRLQRWCGVLEISGGAFEDTTPIFADSNDPFSVRFNVSPVVALDFEHSIPIAVADLWANLSFTKSFVAGSAAWAQAQRMRQSLV